MHSSAIGNLEITRRSSVRTIVAAFACAVLIWSLDFKAQSSGSGAAVQGILLLVYSMSLILLFGLARQFEVRLGSLVALVAVVAIYEVEGSIVGLYGNQPLYLLLVNGIPSFIYASAAAAAFTTLAVAPQSGRDFLNILVTACLVFTVGHFFLVAVLGGGIDLSKSRYEFISGALVPSLALAAVSLILRLRKIDGLVVILNLCVLLVSVTRTILVVLAMQFLSVFIVRPSALLRSAALRRLTLLLIAVALIVSIDLSAGTGLTNRWLQRITVSQRMGFDPTAYTRIAETHFMWKEFTSNAFSVMFGNGLAAPTSLIGREALYAQIAEGKGVVDIHGFGYGHQHVVSVLFIGGLIGGVGMLILQILNFIQALLVIRILTRPNIELEDNVIRIGLWGSFIVIGMVVTGIFGGTFGDRDICLWYGIGTGMLYWIRKFLRNSTHS